MQKSYHIFNIHPDINQLKAIERQPPTHLPKEHFIKVRRTMKQYFPKEQSDIIKGWEDNDDAPLYFHPSPQPSPPPAQDNHTRKSSTSHQKVPSSLHRRTNSKPFTAKTNDLNGLIQDKQLLHKFIPTQSKQKINRGDSVNPPKEQLEPIFKTLPKYQRKSICGMSLEFPEDAPSKTVKQELFSGLASQKKNRRKIYAKTKILDEFVPYEQPLHQNRCPEPFKTVSNSIDFLRSKQTPISEQPGQKKQNRLRLPTHSKKRTFPIFFREVQLQQKEQEKRLLKKILEQKIKQRRMQGQFMLASSKTFNNSMEFTDSNIFPYKVIRT